MKDYRAPAIKKPRKVSGFNVWQNNWWETEGKGDINCKSINYQI